MTLLTNLLDKLPKSIATTAFVNPVTLGLEMQVAAFQSGFTKDQLVTTGGGNEVSTWSDFSGNNRDFTQGTGSAQPIYTLNAINGRPTLEHNGSTQYLEAPFSAGLNPAAMTIFIVCKVTGGQGTFRSPLTSRSDTGGLKGYYFYATFNNKWSFTSGDGTGTWVSDIAGGSVIIGENVILRATCTNGAQTFHVNNVLIGTNTENFIPNSDRPARIGAGTTEGAAGFIFDGFIGEVIKYNRILLNAEINAVEGYLSVKWGI